MDNFIAYCGASYIIGLMVPFIGSIANLFHIPYVEYQHFEKCWAILEIKGVYTDRVVFTIYQHFYDNKWYGTVCWIIFNSLRPSDAIWCHGANFHWYFLQNTFSSIKIQTCYNVVCRMVIILFRPWWIDIPCNNYEFFLHHLIFFNNFSKLFFTQGQYFNDAIIYEYIILLIP